MSSLQDGLGKGLDGSAMVKGNEILFAYLIVSIFVIVSDLKKRVIPDALTIPGSLVGILLNTFLPTGIGLKESIAGFLAGFVSILIAGVISSMLSERPTLGGGDLKLMGMVGAFWGVKVVLITFAIAPFLAAFWAMKYLQTRSAYGVFIVGSSLIALIIGGLKQ